MTARRLLIILASVAAFVALIHVPPNPSVVITSSSDGTSTDLMHGQWLVNIALALTTTAACIVLAIATWRHHHRAAVIVAATATILSVITASDLSLSLNVQATVLTLNSAFIASAAFVTSVVVYYRSRTAAQPGSDDRRSDA